MGARPGQDAPHARLNRTQVWLIRVIYATGRVSMSTLASLFIVGKSTIQNIVQGDTWRT